MNRWAEDDREPLNARGYMKMLGRPRTERRREVNEPAKGTKMPKFGTVIRYTKCKQDGHNKSSCHKHNGAGPNTACPQQVACPSQNLSLSSTEGSCAASMKRKSTTIGTTSPTLQSRTTKSKQKV